jgi:hypothetical protein
MMLLLGLCSGTFGESGTGDWEVGGRCWDGWAMCRWSSNEEWHNAFDSDWIFFLNSLLLFWNTLFAVSTSCTHTSYLIDLLLFALWQVLLRFLELAFL